METQPLYCSCILRTSDLVLHVVQARPLLYLCECTCQHPFSQRCEVVLITSSSAHQHALHYHNSNSNHETTLGLLLFLHSHFLSHCGRDLFSNYEEPPISYSRYYVTQTHGPYAVESEWYSTHVNGNRSISEVYTVLFRKGTSEQRTYQPINQSFSCSIQ